MGGINHAQLVARSPCKRAFFWRANPITDGFCAFLCTYVSVSGVGWRGVGGGNNIPWHFHTHVMLHCIDEMPPAVEIKKSELIKEQNTILTKASKP